MNEKTKELAVQLFQELERLGYVTGDNEHKTLFLFAHNHSDNESMTISSAGTKDIEVDFPHGTLFRKGATHE